MKKVTAHINTIRVHWIVEELQKIGVQEIMVTEYFRPNCQISKVEFLCEDHDVNEIRDVIHTAGTIGISVDHSIDICEIEGKVKSIFPFV
ncbi:MAG: hypothetical protein IPJ03_19080 [Ignavibacteriales bacterium]|nr:hypothetical protein [Ignavibacteriales bacterium]MBK7381059.1 hypothetical protein [Ignavibacteriales bacterium]